MHRALAHFNHEAFEVDRLTIFEDPAIAIIALSDSEVAHKKNSFVGQTLKRLLGHPKPDLSFSVKVTADNHSGQRFSVTYSWKDSPQSKLIDPSNTCPHQDKIEHIVKNMFGSINDSYIEP